MGTLDNWSRVKLVLEGALALDGAEQSAYLAEACGGDTTLRAEVERLLSARGGAHRFLETPALLLDDRALDDDQSGRVVGSYHLLSRLGAGGMGEVYRARDTRLNRDVAIKVLPNAFATNAERLARFKREAQLLASLNHPNIGSIYGFEDSGKVHALVLELVEGPTLADRIADGAVPLDETLRIARQIVEAVDAAHQHRIIHRDLKPANIKLRPDGTVKVLDFGLAKALDLDAPASASKAIEPDLSGLPAAGARLILGTASYMSPEQALGKPVDKRCDIWAFGCVLYEMITGRRPFEGESVTEILAHIIEREADFDRVPGSTPASIRRLLRRCLEKDPRKRIPDIGVARIEIEDAMMSPIDVESLGKRASSLRIGQPWLIGTALVVGLAIGALVYSRFALTESPALMRVSIPLAEPLEFGVQQPALAISPDGTRIVYRPSGTGPLRSRLLHDEQSSVIPGTEGAISPFFSPDGRSVAFFVGQSLKKVAFAGGGIVTVATLPRNVGAQGYRGGAWADDGTIAFASSTGAGLFAVSERGGEAKALTLINPKAGEAAHRWPSFLPGGKAVLFTVKSSNLQSFDDAQIVVRSLDTGEQHPVAQGDSAQYVPTGHLVYARAGALYAVRFNAATLTVTGAPVKVAERVVTHPESGGAQVAISRTGTLVYAAGGSTTAERPLLWVDRGGAARPLTDRHAPFWWPRLSRDGRRVVVVIDAAFSKLWVIDIERGTITRASQIPGDQDRAVWMPDGVHVTFGADATGSGVTRLFSDLADGTSTATLLFESSESATPLSWSPDGRRLLYRRVGASTGLDVWVYSVDDRASKPLLQTESNESSAAFSPDGRWVAYASDDSGVAEVYVRPFAGGARTQVSIDGGTAPVWSRDGRELFFAKGDALFAAKVTRGNVFTSGAVQRLFSGPYSFEEVAVNYDVAPDGQHFVVARSRIDSAPRQLELVLHWFEELNRLAPK